MAPVNQPEDSQPDRPSGTPAHRTSPGTSVPPQTLQQAPPSHHPLTQEDSELSAILRDAGDGGASANELLPLVYAQLRLIAKQRMQSEKAGHTLQATALVHEAYARIQGDRKVAWQGRAHFFNAAAEAMRRILIDHARARAAIKRGGELKKLDLTTMSDVADLANCPDPDQIVRIDDAILRLQEKDARAAQVVRLRFYAGLSIDDTATALGVSKATVERDWQFARAWLFVTLDER